VLEEMNNTYILCVDLMRVAVFNKDAIDFYNMKCTLGFQIVGKISNIIIIIILFLVF
jgi:hypothetical protein